MKNKMKSVKNFGRMLAMATIVCLLVCMMIPLSAFAANDKVTDCANGVLQVNLAYRDDNNSNWIFMAGSGFLINSDTLVTCAHCVNLTDAECAIYAEIVGKSISEFKDRLSCSVTVARDVTVPATIEQISVEMDFAILHLSQSLQNASPLSIRSSSDVERTEIVYAIGFPDESSRVQAVNTYTSEDATITQGVVNKIGQGPNLYSGAGTDYLQTSCKLTHGSSGGPMVDENGYVIGVCEGATGTIESGDDYFYAVAIDQVTQVCDALGIIYYTDTTSEPEVTETEATSETEDTTEPVVLDFSVLSAAIDEAEAIAEDGYTEDSYAAMQTALEAAKETQIHSNDQAQIDAAARDLENAIDSLKHKESNSLMLILIIAGVVVVAIVAVIIVLVASSSKKKKASASRSATSKVSTSAPAAVGSGAFAPSHMSTPTGGRPSGTVPLNPEAGETTILNQGAGETTVLSNNVNGGSLIRLSNKERIPVNKAELTIGRERKRVDYCISDNTSISRVHVKLVVRDRKTYLVDMNAANGTFVNGVKANPNQEIALKDGDKITLAAEDFEYRV